MSICIAHYAKTPLMISDGGGCNTRRVNPDVGNIRKYELVRVSVFELTSNQIDRRMDGRTDRRGVTRNAAF